MSEKTANAYLIHLTSGDGDTTLTLVNHETWSWFMERIDSPDEVFAEPPEEQVVGVMASNECSRKEAINLLNGYEDSGSLDNDIALLMVPSKFDGEIYADDTISGLFAFVTKHKLTLTDEYNGFMY